MPESHDTLSKIELNLLKTFDVDTVSIPYIGRSGCSPWPLRRTMQRSFRGFQLIAREKKKDEPQPAYTLNQLFTLYPKSAVYFVGWEGVVRCEKIENTVVIDILQKDDEGGLHVVRSGARAKGSVQFTVGEPLRIPYEFDVNEYPTFQGSLPMSLPSVVSSEITIGHFRGLLIQTSTPIQSNKYPTQPANFISFLPRHDTFYRPPGM